MWTDQAKGLANQSLNAALRAARDSTVALVEEAARTNAGVVRDPRQFAAQITGRYGRDGIFSGELPLNTPEEVALAVWEQLTF
jgi:hypothetical protein